MKRRDIIKSAGTLLAGIPVVTESQTRRFGVPGSISGASPTRQAQLHLRLAKADIPIQFWKTIERIDALWRSVTTDAAAQDEFRRNPSGVIAAHGIDPSLMSGSDRESRVLRALLKPSVTDALRRRDYSAFINELQAIGIRADIAPSGLVRRLVEAFRNDLEKYRSLLAAGAVHEDGAASAESAVRLAATLPGAEPLLVWFATHVVVAVDAVVAVVVFVVVAGVERPEALLQTTRSLAPEDFEQIVDANRVARLVGAAEVQSVLIRNAVRSEVEAVVLAAEAAGIAQFQGRTRQQVVDAVTRRILRVTT
ncbi:MAG: hypothetical protein OHK0044_32400 [Burkholderiaceae bacterium]